MKDTLRGVGKKIDESISVVASNVKEKTKEATKSMAKAAVKKTAKGATKVAMSVGKTIEQKMKDYSERVKNDIGIKKEMTPGQKAGVVVEKVVDTIAKGIGKLAEKIDEKQAKRFATPQELRVEGFDVLIGEGLDKAISIQRAVKSKEFAISLRSNKKKLPYQLKDMREEILKDILRGACINFISLLNYLKNIKTAETRAEIDYLKKEIQIIKQKIIEEEENGTENQN